MEIEEALPFIDELVNSRTGEHLSEPQKMVLTASWRGLKYGEIEVPGYTHGYIERTIAPGLWNLMTSVIGEKVTKKSLRSVVENFWMRRSKSVTEFQPSTSSTPENPVKIETFTDIDGIESELGFCQAHILFQQHYQETFEIESSSNSDLCYFFINTKYFNNCKARLIRIISRYQSENISTEPIQDAVIWSLLGNAELLVTFRATDDIADNFQYSLQEELYGILKEPHDESHSGIFMIKIAEEFLRISTSSSGSREEIFMSGRRLYRKVFPYEELRSLKVFIKLHFLGDGRISNRLINNLNAHIRDFIDVLEGYSVSTNGRYIIIEVHMPCGRLFRLNQLSKALENVLSNNLLKETYLAYDLTY